MIHEIVLNGYTAHNSNSRCLHFGTRGSYGIEQLRVIPGDGWEDMLISVTFHPPGMEPARIILGDTRELEVPPEATAVVATEFMPGKIVFAGARDGANIITADLHYLVENHAPISGRGSTPTPNEWEQIASAYNSKLDKQQGTENAGKVLGIGEDGMVKPVDQTGGGTKAGVTFTPAVSEEGVISWTNDGDLPNPDPVNIKGDPFTYEDFTEEQLNALKGKNGDDYVLTEADKQEIAEQAAQRVEIPSDDHINSLINTALGVIENGTY